MRFRRPRDNKDVQLDLSRLAADSRRQFSDVYVEKVEEAPADGESYVRKDGAWVTAPVGTGNSYFPTGW